MDQESLTQIQQIVGTAAEALRADIADAKRHTGVLTEGLRHELQLVAEGFQMHLDRRHADDRVYLDEQFKETRALIQLSLWTDPRTRRAAGTTSPLHRATSRAHCVEPVASISAIEAIISQ